MLETQFGLTMRYLPTYNEDKCLLKEQHSIFLGLCPYIMDLYLGRDGRGFNIWPKQLQRLRTQTLMLDLLEIFILCFKFQERKQFNGTQNKLI